MSLSLERRHWLEWYLRTLMDASRHMKMLELGYRFDTVEAPGPYFQKEFFHNGYVKSLKQLVHFYNTRDKKGYAYPVTSGHCPQEQPKGWTFDFTMEEAGPAPSGCTNNCQS
jgi:cytochrome c peroxidase